MQQFAGDGKRGHDGDALETDHLAAVAHLEHAPVDVSYRLEQLALLVLGTGDAELTAHHLEVDVLHRYRHQPSSGRRSSSASSLARAASTFSPRRLLSFWAC